MTKEEFFKKTAEDYFDELFVPLDDFCQMLKIVCPVFGVLKTNIEDTEDGNKEIIFIDEDKVDAVFSTNSGEVMEESLLDMSSIILKLIIDKKGKVILVEHGIPFLTPANKELILFFGGLVNKRIIL